MSNQEKKPFVIGKLDLSEIQKLDVQYGKQCVLITNLLIQERSLQSEKDKISAQIDELYAQLTERSAQLEEIKTSRENILTENISIVHRTNDLINALKESAKSQYLNVTKDILTPEEEKSIQINPDGTVTISRNQDN